MGGLGCDNMTVVLVCFLNENSYEHLAERCSTIPKTTLTDNQESTNGTTEHEMKEANGSSVIADALAGLSEASSTSSDSSDNDAERSQPDTNDEKNF